MSRVGPGKRIRNRADDEEANLESTVLLALCLKISHEKLSMSWNIIEMQIKATVRWISSHQSEWPLSKSLQTIKSGKVVEKCDPPALMLGMWVVKSHDGGRGGGSLNSEKWKNLHLSLTAYRRRNSKSIKESNRGTIPEQNKVWHKSQQVLFGSMLRIIQNKRKLKRKAPHLPEKLLHRKGNPKGKKKTTLRMVKCLQSKLKTGIHLQTCKLLTQLKIRKTVNPVEKRAKI